LGVLFRHQKPLAIFLSAVLVFPMVCSASGDFSHRAPRLWGSEEALALSSLHTHASDSKAQKVYFTRRAAALLMGGLLASVADAQPASPQPSLPLEDVLFQFLDAHLQKVAPQVTRETLPEMKTAAYWEKAGLKPGAAKPVSILFGATAHQVEGDMLSARIHRDLVLPSEWVGFVRRELLARRLLVRMREHPMESLLIYLKDFFPLLLEEQLQILVAQRSGRLRVVPSGFVLSSAAEAGQALLSFRYPPALISAVRDLVKNLPQSYRISQTSDISELQFIRGGLTTRFQGLNKQLLPYHLVIQSGLPIPDQWPMFIDYSLIRLVGEPLTTLEDRAGFLARAYRGEWLVTYRPSNKRLMQSVFSLPGINITVVPDAVSADMLNAQFVQLWLIHTGQVQSSHPAVSLFRPYLLTPSAERAAFMAFASHLGSLTRSRDALKLLERWVSGLPSRTVRPTDQQRYDAMIFRVVLRELSAELAISTQLTTLLRPDGNSLTWEDGQKIIQILAPRAHRLPHAAANRFQFHFGPSPFKPDTRTARGWWPWLAVVALFPFSRGKVIEISEDQRAINKKEMKLFVEGTHPRFSEIRSRAVALAQRIVHNRPDAEDIFQESWILVRTKYETFTGASKVDSYMHRVVINKALEWIKRRSPMRAEELIPGMASSDPNPLEEYIKKDAAHLLHGFLSALTPIQRELIYLQYVLGMSYTEMAGMTGRTDNAVKQLLFRARRQILTRIFSAPGIADRLRSLLESPSLVRDTYKTAA